MVSVIEYKNGIMRDTCVAGNNVYLDKGQSCGTVWFKTVNAARKALEKDGVKTGPEFFNCEKCSCNYSFSDSRGDQFLEYRCNKHKEKYARSFE